MSVKFWISLIILGFTTSMLRAQTYTSYLTGSSEDVTTNVSFGICLMGGGSENDEAMMRFLQSAEGGDIVVLRAAGTDGYNDYLYSDLGVSVNSVETLVIPSSDAAQDSYVEQQIRAAEALWIAGGNQWDYISFWKDTPVQDAINDHVTVKQAPLGGTSAGMAILGQSYFTAENGTVYSDEALQDPYNNYMTFGHNDFLVLPYMEKLITDTHYENPDRKGRHTAFLARLANDFGLRSFGIAADEYTAVFVDQDGIASVYGEAAYDDYAYFLQANCVSPFLPENCTAGEALEWDRDQAAVKVYVVKGEEGGLKHLDLSDWQSGNGGYWENWYVTGGLLHSLASEAPDCPTSRPDAPQFGFSISPNPANNQFRIQVPANIELFSVQIYSIDGRLMSEYSSSLSGNLDISFLNEGMYIVKVCYEKGVVLKKLIIVR